MGGGHGDQTYKGMTLHAPKRWHSVTGKGMCALMWAGGIPGTDMTIMDMDTRRKTMLLDDEAISFLDAFINVISDIWSIS
ncbi:hypothetical protein KSS87_015933 [Heliosperma pusillum]|nr:hypothetical protein KSS87_015933 [Heliosperma pusillum]